MTAGVAEMTFAEKLAEVRDESGLSVAGLATAAGLSLNTVNDYLYKDKIPSATNLFKLARALGVSCEVFSMCENAEDDNVKGKSKGK